MSKRIDQWAPELKTIIDPSASIEDLALTT